MAEKTLVDRGPEIFVGVGVFLLLLAAYIAGGDQITCRRADAAVTCDVDRKRILGLFTSEHVHAADIVSLSIAQTSDRKATQLSSRSGKVAMNTNTLLIATTRTRRDVELAGGEAAGKVVDDLEALVNGKRADPVVYWDSYAMVAGFVCVLGLVFLTFGGVAMRLGG